MMNRTNSDRPALTILVLPVFCWAIVISLLSTDTFSATHTGNLLSFLFSANGTWFGLVHFLMRKGAHLTEYAILGWLIFRVIRGISTQPVMISFLIAVSICFAYACLDEFHQSFVPSRTASFRDVTYDSVGGTIGCLMYLVRWTRTTRAEILQHPSRQVSETQKPVKL